MQQTLPPSPPAALPALAPVANVERQQRRQTRRAIRRRRLGRYAKHGFRLGVLLLILLLPGRASFTWRAGVQAQVAAATTGAGWDLTGWTFNALGEKAAALVSRPAVAESDASGAAFVTIFMARARDIRELEREVERLTAEDAPAATIADSAAQLAGLRTQQETERPRAESTIEAQVTSVLRDLGFGVGGRLWPPVLFTFTESPSKLVVSARDRIGQAAYQMVEPGMPLATLSAIEAQVEASASGAGGVSAYIAPTGGLGAFPTLVVNRGSLEWVLSTVAHEWAHTYLAFFPLGFSYGSNPDNILINETVAEIVGNEVGRLVLERYYPDQVPPPQPDAVLPSALLPPDQPPAFDYDAEMRHTRATLDKFLSVGRVEDAERYLELRRLLFVENGYTIRKLNQAWFAFHGSYGASPAAASTATADGPALAPLITQLRAELPNLVTFLRTLRTVTTRADLEALHPRTPPN